MTNRLPATGRYQPSAYEDDKGKDHPPRKNQRTSMPANRQRWGNTSTTMDNISRISAISPAHDDEEGEPQATPPRTKGLWGALARKIPPTKLPLGKAFCFCLHHYKASPLLGHLFSLFQKDALGSENMSSGHQPLGKIPPTKLPLGKAFCQTVAANALDDD